MKSSPAAGSKSKSSKSDLKQPETRTAIPMTPRRGLFRALLAVFFVWVGVMLAMYVTTVRPRTHSAPPPSREPASTAPALAGEPAR